MTANMTPEIVAAYRRAISVADTLLALQNASTVLGLRRGSPEWEAAETLLEAAEVADHAARSALDATMSSLTRDERTEMLNALDAQEAR